MSLRRIVVATFIGQVTEWYDYAIYALVATQIAAHFFPSDDKDKSLLAALAVFGIAFVARPLGGLVIGALGDRIGRRNVLVLSLLLMTGATGLMGILPTAATIGPTATVLLVALRFLQGISAAGESTSAITFVAESAPPRRRGLFVALLLSGNSTGALLATGVTWFLRQSLGIEAFDNWGWRICFLLAIPLGLAGLYIRRTLDETPVFRELQATGSLSTAPIRDTFVLGWRQLLQAVSISALSFVANYLIIAYLPIHLDKADFAPNSVSIIAAATTGTLMVGYPLMGALSDIIGRKAVMLAGSLILALTGWPLFAMTTASDLSLAIAAAVLLALPTAAFIACLGLYCTEFIEKSRLMTTYSTGFNLSGAIFGGSSLWAFGWLAQSTGDSRMPGAYLVLAAILSFAALLTVRARRPE